MLLPASDASPLGRALQALRATVPPTSDPFAAAILRAQKGLGLPADVAPLLAFWNTREIGTPTSAMRYRWEISHERCDPPSWAPSPAEWKAWRPAEQSMVEQEPFRFEERLSLPVLLAETCELLSELANSATADEVGTASEAGDGAPRRARAMLDEALPVFRRDLSSFLQGANPWSDTFALACLVRTPLALETMHPFALAIAACHSPTAKSRGTLLGARFPFHDVPLVSATAQLATGLLALGVDLELVATLVESVREAQKPSGGWGDGDGPCDPLTSIAAADLLVHTDPTFDAGRAAEWFAGAQSDAGFWSALGPDAPWLTARIAAWLVATQRPFAERFRWPHLSAQHKDSKTGLPSFGYFGDLSRLFVDLPGLAQSRTEVAFFDLAGFGEFNNTYGQDMGDAVLAAFATELSAVTAARAIRDGGDEFLVVGAPGRADLARDLDAFRREWPARFRARFGDGAPPVAPRALVVRAPGRALRQARETLGRAVGNVKDREREPPPEGVLVELGDLVTLR
jgi:GGDEF domain-containing protein